VVRLRSLVPRVSAILCLAWFVAACAGGPSTTATSTATSATVGLAPTSYQQAVKRGWQSISAAFNAPVCRSASFSGPGDAYPPELLPTDISDCRAALIRIGARSGRLLSETASLAVPANLAGPGAALRSDLTKLANAAGLATVALDQSRPHDFWAYVGDMSTAIGDGKDMVSLIGAG
jgi:hypothetical protein